MAKLASKARSIVRSSVNRFLLRPAKFIFTYISAKAVSVIPTPLALFVISELRNLALTVRISGIIIQILLMITSKLLLVLYGKLQKAATDLAKQTGLDDAWIVLATTFVANIHRFVVTLAMIFLMGVNVALSHVTCVLDKAILYMGQA